MREEVVPWEPPQVRASEEILAASTAEILQTCQTGGNTLFFFYLNLFILIRVYPHIPSDEKNNSNISWKDSLWAPHFGHCQKILYFEQYYHPSKNLVESVH